MCKKNLTQTKTFGENKKSDFCVEKSQRDIEKKYLHIVGQCSSLKLVYLGYVYRRACVTANMDSADDFVDECAPARKRTSQSRESRPSSSSVAVDCVSEEEPTPTTSAIPEDGPRGEERRSREAAERPVWGGYWQPGR